MASKNTREEQKWVCGLDQCGKEPKKVCSKCRRVSYCSRDHQVTDWKNHKKVCHIAHDPPKAVGDDPLQSIKGIFSGMQVPQGDIMEEVKDLSTEGIPLRMLKLKNRGVGLIATRDIKRGELIFQEKPIMTPATDEKKSLTDEGVQLFVREDEEEKRRIEMKRHRLKPGELKRIMNGFNNLSSADKAKYMELHDSFRTDPSEPKSVCGIYITNSVEQGEDGSVCMLVSRINHSCVPNVQHVWAEPFERVVSCRDIQRGEEIFTSYVMLDQGRLQRNMKLSQQYGFTCYCAACTLDGWDTKQGVSLQQLSDQRRNEMRELDRIIKYLGQSDPITALKCVDNFLELQKKEGLELLTARTSYDAFQIAVLMGDLSLAEKWIHRAHSHYTIRNFADSTLVKELFGYLQNPKSHETLGLAQRFGTLRL